MAQLETLLFYLSCERENFTREISKTDRCAAIAAVLKNDESLVYISFAIFLAGIMEDFIVNYQSYDP